MRRKFLCAFSALIACCLLTMLICDYVIRGNAGGKLYDDVAQIPHRNVGVLLGTTPQSRYGHETNLFFSNRINATAELYKAGKVDSMIVSGSSYSLDDVDETIAMRDTLVKHGIPEDHILLDGKGFRTINSMENVITVFGQRRFTVISQPFHNERAIYQAEHLNLGEVNVIGFNAADVHSTTAFVTYVREYLARMKVFIDVYL